MARCAAGTMIYGLRMTKIDGAAEKEAERKGVWKERNRGVLQRVKRGQKRGKSINFRAD